MAIVAAMKAIRNVGISRFLPPLLQAKVQLGMHADSKQNGA